MATRTEKSAASRDALYQGRLERAETPRQRLWVACGWLVAEAWRAGRLHDTCEHVLGLIDGIRKEPTT